MKSFSATTTDRTENGDTPTTNNEKKSTEGCPYAVALEDAASTASSSLHHDDHNLMMEESSATLLQKCPAFADNQSCPFKDVTSSEALKAKFLTIPPSHYQMKAFTAVLAKLHQTATAHDNANKASSSSFAIPGGCPIPEEIKHQMSSFRQAMEDLSLAAIMGRMAESLEDKSLLPDQWQEEDDEDGNEDKEESKNKPKESPMTITTSTSDSDTPRDHRPSLSESLKTGTAVSHQAAEDVHFVRNFIRGEIDRELYSKLVVALYHVYVRLEQHLDQYGPAHFPTCHFPEELQRKASLEEDMDFWNGRLDVPPSPATVDYMNRLDEIARTDPLLLLAHAYTRYLGDLSGGKVLARVAGRALHLDRHTMEGLAFYQFEKIPSAKRFKDQYRQALDDLSLTTAQIERLVAEANVAFCLNVRVFEELDVYANVPNATVRPLEEALAYANPALLRNAKTPKSAEAECPFLAQSSQNATPGTNAKTKKGRCPWPFVLAHHPVQFMNDWQTWVLCGILLCFLWSQYNSNLTPTA